MKGNVKLSSGKVLTYMLPAHVTVGDDVTVPPVGWWSNGPEHGTVVAIQGQDPGPEYEGPHAFYDGPCKTAWAPPPPCQCRATKSVHLGCLDQLDRALALALIRAQQWQQAQQASESPPPPDPGHGAQPAQQAG